MPNPDVRLQVNFKTPKGTLINAYAESPAQLDAELASLAERAGRIAEVESLLCAVQNVASEFGRVEDVPQGEDWAPYGAPRPEPSVRPVGNPEFIHQQPPGPIPTDGMGRDLTWLSAKKGSGKSWKGWFSPVRKGEPGWQDPIFVK